MENLKKRIKVNTLTEEVLNKYYNCKKAWHIEQFTYIVAER